MLVYVQINLWLVKIQNTKLRKQITVFLKISNDCPLRNYIIKYDKIIQDVKREMSPLVQVNMWRLKRQSPGLHKQTAVTLEMSLL